MKPAQQDILEMDVVVYAFILVGTTRVTRVCNATILNTVPNVVLVCGVTRAMDVFV